MPYFPNRHHALSPRNNLPDTSFHSHSADQYLQKPPADMPRPQHRSQSQGYPALSSADEYANQQQQQQHLYYSQQPIRIPSGEQHLDYYYSPLQQQQQQHHHDQLDAFDDSDPLINWPSVPRSSFSNTNSPEISRPFTPIYDSFPTQNSPYIRSPSGSFPNQSPISIAATVEKLNSAFPPIPLPPSYYTVPAPTNPQSSPLSYTFLPDSPFSSSPLPLTGSPNNAIMQPTLSIDPPWHFTADMSSASSIISQPTTLIQQPNDQVWSEFPHFPPSSPSSAALDPSTVKVEQSTPERHSMPLAMSPTLLMLTPGLANTHSGNELVFKEEHTMSPHFETPSPHYEESYDNYTSESDTPNPVNLIAPPFPSVSQSAGLIPGSSSSRGVSVPSRNGSSRKPSARNTTASTPRVDWNIQKKSRGRHVPTIKSVYGTFENALEVVDAMAAAGVKNDRPYLCACGLCFQRNEHLKRHQNSIHSNVKPFACPAKDCNKSFSRRDNLFQHLHVHRKEDIPHGYQLPNTRKRSPT